MSFTHFSLGLGNRGTSGPIVGLAMNETLVSQEKKTVRKVFPTSSKVDGKFLMTGNFSQTPFRIAMNAGDANLRQNSTASGVASGNQHFVYDSSDYIRFKRLQNKNRNYNDPSH
jgi:hypothetical protein